MNFSSSSPLDDDHLLSKINPMKKSSTCDFNEQSAQYLTIFSTWNDQEQLLFVENLLKTMHNHQHGQINTFLFPMLQRDFIGRLASCGLEHLAEKILTYLDHQSLKSTELVCREWYHVIAQGLLKNIEN